MGEAFDSIALSLVLVETYEATDVLDPWKIFDPIHGTPFDDLQVLRRGQGYWINVNRDVVLSYGGHQYRLFRGWNLIGWQD